MAGSSESKITRFGVSNLSDSWADAGDVSGLLVSSAKFKANHEVSKTKCGPMQSMIPR